MAKEKKAPTFIQSIALIIAGLMYTSFIGISAARYLQAGYVDAGYAALTVMSAGIVMLFLGVRRFHQYWKFQPEGEGPVKTMDEWRKEHE